MHTHNRFQQQESVTSAHIIRCSIAIH